MKKSVGRNESDRVQNLFFANKNRWIVLSEEREMELGWIIKKAREDLNREEESLANLAEITQDIIKKIKGPVFDLDCDGRGCVDLHVEMDQENDFETDNEDEKTINVPGKNPFNLDEEEMDIFELLTGERELRGNDVIPDDELIKQFTVFRKRNKNADKAVRELAEGHMGLIVSIARRYREKGVPFMELIQEGYKGAQDAAERFDPARKARFSTYAAYWIQQRVRAVIVKKTREIRYPQHVAETLHKVKWAVNEIRHEANRKGADAPTEEEIAVLIGATTEKVKKLMNLPFAEKILDAPYKDDETENGMHDVLADGNIPSADYLMTRAMMANIVAKLLLVLRSDQRMVIEKRFGLNGYKEDQTLAEISEGKLSRERIRQIESMALMRLRRKLEILMRDNDIDREDVL